MSESAQLSFLDGMDLISSDVDISSKAYREAFNVRQRFGKLEAIPSALDITYNLSVAGKFQGLYAFNNIFIAFYSGKAFYLVINGPQTWTRIPNFAMDSGVDYIYAQAVPTSTNNFFRQGVVNTTTGKVDSSAGILNTSGLVISGTPSGIVCQDGINQPYLISYDPISGIVTSRLLQTYNEWTTDTTNPLHRREYVPIGTLMMYLGGILYIVNGFTIYRSVSGRPLDFMVNVDANGEKLPTEALGGATTTSFAIDYQTITALVPSTTTANAFLVGTARYLYGMQPDFTNTIFAEPTFDRIFTVEAGVVNQFSFTDSNGDTPFIDYEGIKFFNAVEQLRFEGSNDPLSKNISNVLKNITQNICCCTQFDNYNLFAINSFYGYVIAIFDNMSKKWVSLDLTNYTAGGIKMFAEATLPNARYLACGNNNNKMFLLYQGAIRECGTVFMRPFLSGDWSAYGNYVLSSLRVDQKLNYVKVAVTRGTVDDTMYCRIYVDDFKDADLEQTITGRINSILYPVRPPVRTGSGTRIYNVVFTLDAGITGYKIQPVIVWKSDLTIERIEVSTSNIGEQVSPEQQEVTLSQ